MSTVLLQPEGSNEAVSVQWAPDTTVGSLLHRIVAYKPTTSVSPSRVKIYLVSVAITYVPLLVAAFFSSHFTSLPLWTSTPDVSLPFLRNWNIAFTFLVSFPTLVVLLSTDDYVLATSLRRIQKHGVICIAGVDSFEMTKFNKYFRTANFVAQGLGVGIGLALGCATLHLYLSPPVGFWIASKDHLLPVGYVYFYCIALLYAIITIYVLRCVVFSVLLIKVVAHSTMHMLPFHPDRCGGLRPIGQLGLRNQYTLSILGLNIVILALVSLLKLKGLPSQHHLVTAATVAYLILGPLIFMAPLLPFRKGMLKAKADWMSDIERRLHTEFERLRMQIQSGQITKGDVDLVDRWRKISSVIDELPVWPFDARTLRTFASAYVAPLVPLGYPLVGKVLHEIVIWLTAT
jgi:hypothetical protein